MEAWESVAKVSKLTLTVNDNGGEHEKSSRRPQKTILESKQSPSNSFHSSSSSAFPEGRSITPSGAGELQSSAGESPVGDGT